MAKPHQFKNRLVDWWEICWLAKWSEVNMVNLARSATLCCTITTLISGLTSLLHLSCILLCLNHKEHCNNRQRCLEMLTFSSTHYSSRVTKTKAKWWFWIRPGRMPVWWDNFLNGVMIAEEWKENFRMGKDNFYKLCGELRLFIKRKDMDMYSLLIPRSNWRRAKAWERDRLDINGWI